VLTAFPQFYRPHLDYGLVSKAIERGELSLTPWSLRRFTEDHYGEIDDRVYGGKFGMLMKPEPYFRGVEHLTETRGSGTVVMTAPDGLVLDNKSAKRLSNRSRMIILTGRYEGVDQRVREHLVDEVWSIGPYVTPGGDLPALVLISSIIRHIPGVVQNKTSVECDSFQNETLAPPHYTRPAEFRGYQVPEVLRSGDHQKIEQWRRRQSEIRTRHWKQRTTTSENDPREE